MKENKAPDPGKRRILKNCLVIFGGMAVAWLAIMFSVLVLPDLIHDLPPLWNELIGIGAIFAPLWFLVVFIYLRIEKFSPGTQRIKPLTKMSTWLVSAISLAVVDVIIVIFEQFLKKILFHNTDTDVLEYTIFYLNLFVIPIAVAQLYRAIKARVILERFPGIATATIIQKSTRQKTQFYGEGLPYSMNYLLTLEFTPNLAVNLPEKMNIDAQVNGMLYERSEPGQVVNIRYAVEDPHIFLIEGE